MYSVFVRFSVKKIEHHYFGCGGLRKPPARYTQILKNKKEEEKIWRFINQVIASHFYLAGI